MGSAGTLLAQALLGGVQGYFGAEREAEQRKRQDALLLIQVLSQMRSPEQLQAIAPMLGQFGYQPQGTLEPGMQTQVTGLEQALGGMPQLQAPQLGAGGMPPLAETPTLPPEAQQFIQMLQRGVPQAGLAGSPGDVLLGGPRQLPVTPAMATTEPFVPPLTIDPPPAPIPPVRVEQTPTTEGMDPLARSLYEAQQRKYGQEERSERRIEAKEKRTGVEHVTESLERVAPVSTSRIRSGETVSWEEIWGEIQKGQTADIAARRASRARVGGGGSRAREKRIRLNAAISQAWKAGDTDTFNDLREQFLAEFGLEPALTTTPGERRAAGSKTFEDRFNATESRLGQLQSKLLDTEKAELKEITSEVGLLKSSGGLFMPKNKKKAQRLFQRMARIRERAELRAQKDMDREDLPPSKAGGFKTADGRGVSKSDLLGMLKFSKGLAANPSAQKAKLQQLQAMMGDPNFRPTDESTSLAHVLAGRRPDVVMARLEEMIRDLETDIAFEEIQ